MYLICVPKKSFSSACTTSSTVVLFWPLCTTVESKSNWLKLFFVCSIKSLGLCFCCSLCLIFLVGFCDTCLIVTRFSVETKMKHNVNGLQDYRFFCFHTHPPSRVCLLDNKHLYVCPSHNAFSSLSVSTILTLLVCVNQCNRINRCIHFFLDICSITRWNTKRC